MTTDSLSKRVRIRLLVDNEAIAPFKSEYGLAMWIEADGKKILFDTGQGESLCQNAERAGIDLSLADCVVISHGHYDHTGGLPLVLDQHPTVPIYAHPGWLRRRFSLRNDTVRPIHIQDAVRARVSELPREQRHDVSSVTYLTPKIGLTGAVPRLTTFEDTGGPFYLDPQGKAEDYLEDDMALWISTPTGLVICVGCSHSGVVNIVNRILSLYPANTPVRALLGGFHLIEASSERIDATAEALKLFSIPQMMPCHCTGPKAFEQLRERLGSAVMAGGAGTELVFD